MGFILSKFRKKKSTQEVLEKLENEIKRIQTNKRQSLVTQSTVVRKILTYGLVFWVLASGCIFYLYRSAQKSEDYLIFLPILVLIPCFLIVFRKVLTWWYHSKINKDDAKLSKLQDEKCKILDDVMEKETYKVATQILEKYDPSRLVGKPTDVKLPALSNSRGGGAQPMVVAAASNRLGRGSQPPPNSPGKGMDLRKRIIPPVPAQAPPGLNQSIPLPNSRKEGAPANLNQTIATVGRTPIPPPGMGRGGMPPGMLRGGPPLPRPIIPRERGIMDRMVEYLVGDGPSNRYALICRQCQSHNGMALREEFEYISYRCCYCHYWNPARKQRPMAPRLPLPPPPPPDSPLTSRKSQGSEKGSPNARKTDAQIKEGKRDESDAESKEKEIFGVADIKEENVHTDENILKEANIHELAENQDVHEKVENTENIDEDHHQESDSPDHLLTDYHAEQSISENTENILPDPDENPDDFLSENLIPEENVDEDESASDNQNPDNQAEIEGIEPLDMEFSEHIELINKDIRTEIDESTVPSEYTEPLSLHSESPVPTQQLLQSESALPNESSLPDDEPSMPDESSVPLLMNLSNKSDEMDVDS